MPLQELLWIHEFSFDLPLLSFVVIAETFPRRNKTFALNSSKSSYWFVEPGL